MTYIQTTLKRTASDAGILHVPEYNKKFRLSPKEQILILHRSNKGLTNYLIHDKLDITKSQLNTIRKVGNGGGILNVMRMEDKLYTGIYDKFKEMLSPTGLLQEAHAYLVRETLFYHAMEVYVVHEDTGLDGVDKIEDKDIVYPKFIAPRARLQSILVVVRSEPNLMELYYIVENTLSDEDWMLVNEIGRNGGILNTRESCGYVEKYQKFLELLETEQFKKLKVNPRICSFHNITMVCVIYKDQHLDGTDGDEDNEHDNDSDKEIETFVPYKPKPHNPH